MSALLPDAEALIRELCDRIRPDLGPRSTLVGIHTGGAWLAARLHHELGLATPLGTLDVAFYRDDYARQGLARDPKRSDIPFTVENSDIILVDDVLYTGRTVRAAINELFDYGRPARVALAVLADRGGRELPVCPTYCGARVPVPENKRLRLMRAAGGHLALELHDAD